MSVSIPRLARSEIVYPDSDGKPIADNTLQFRWIVTIKEGLDWVCRDQLDVFVAGDLLWYPVEGKPSICQAPDAMVAFGRPKGDRGSGSRHGRPAHRATGRPVAGYGRRACGVGSVQ
jgi:hypothetical protein